MYLPMKYRFYITYFETSYKDQLSNCLLSNHPLCRLNYVQYSCLGSTCLERSHPHLVVFIYRFNCKTTTTCPLGGLYVQVPLYINYYNVSLG